jgi:subtilisin family serine protease
LERSELSGRLLIILLLFTFSVEAQNLNYLVSFTDKDNSPYSIDQPAEFLSARAIERRSNQQINISVEDLPVNLTYLQGIEAVGSVSVRETSKWFNAALIQALAGDAEALKLLPYVSSVEFIAPGNVGGRVSNQLEVDSLSVFESDTLYQFEILDIPQMRADGFIGENMLVAVMDGGFQGMPSVPAFSNLFSNNRVLMSYDFVGRTADVYQYTDHGTNVMSLLAAEQTGPDYAGIIPNANFILFVTEDINFEYRLEEYRWLIAAEKADSAGANVISSSMGYFIFDDPSMDYVEEDLNGLTSVISRASQKASTKGMLVVTSAGNLGFGNPFNTVLFPGDVIDGLTVGSISASGMQSNFSPDGPTADGRIKPDVVAYGSGTYVINKSGNIINKSGTSFSAPQVAGLAAGIWQAYPQLTVPEILDAMRKSASNSGQADNAIGYGVPSYRAINNYFAAEESSAWFAVYPNPVIEAEKLKIKVFDPARDKFLKIRMFDTLGKPIADDDLQISWQNNEYFLELVSLPRGIYILNLQSDSNFSQVKILKL